MEVRLAMMVLGKKAKTKVDYTTYDDIGCAFVNELIERLPHAANVMSPWQRAPRSQQNVDSSIRQFTVGGGIGISELKKVGFVAKARIRKKDAAITTEYVIDK
eukprot:8370805-Pyramimonas_sp.AAC.1